VKFGARRLRYHTKWPGTETCRILPGNMVMCVFLHRTYTCWFLWCCFSRSVPTETTRPIIALSCLKQT